MTEQETLRGLRKDMLRAAHCGKDGNLQSAFSSLEILWALYSDILRVSPQTDWNLPHDRFILSKGQSNLALITVLAWKGFLDREELDTFCKQDSRISMQADRTKFNGVIENSAGSLGHGFPMAAGMAWASKIRKTDERVYVLAGDGEMNEGTMWEAALFAASEKLDNLTLIIDDNDSIGRMLDMGDMRKKLDAFGFSVQTVDGHNVQQLQQALSARTGKPTAILAKTVRGYGSRTLMEDRSWFHRWPNNEELEMLCAEVDAF